MSPVEKSWAANSLACDRSDNSALTSKQRESLRDAIVEAQDRDGILGLHLGITGSDSHATGRQQEGDGRADGECRFTSGW